MIHTSTDLYNSMQIPLKLSLLVMLLVFSRVSTSNMIVLLSGHPVLLNHGIVFPSPSAGHDRWPNGVCFQI